LLVGQIHNGKKLFSNGFRTVEAATWQWKCSNRQSDTGYLEAIRYGYEESLVTWTPWTFLSAAICKIVDIKDEKVAVRRVAFANVAKCWDIARIGNDVPLMKLCEARYPMADLVGKILKPSVVLVWAGPTIQESCEKLGARRSARFCNRCRHAQSYLAGPANKMK